LSHELRRRELAEVILLRRDLKSLNEAEESFKRVDPTLGANMAQVGKLLRDGLNAKIARELDSAEQNRKFIEARLGDRCQYMRNLAEAAISRPALPTDAPAGGQPPARGFGVMDLVETAVDKNPDPPHWKTVSNGSIDYDLENGSFAHYQWDLPPQTIPAEGATITLTVKATAAPNNSLSTGISASGDFDFSPNPPSFPVRSDGALAEHSQAVKLKPQLSLAHGTVVKLRIGAFYGPGVTYKYRLR
jgi:hypothetical protein